LVHRSKRLYRGVVAIVFLASWSGAPAASAQGPQPEPAAVAAAIERIAARPAFAHALVAAEIYDLDAKVPLYARNGSVLMEAASTTKLLTAGTSLALLGPDFRWTTPVYRVGDLDARGVLHGDIVLVASGDANLSQRSRPDGSLAFENEDHSYDGNTDSRAVPGDPLAVLRELAAQVAKSGVKAVEGRIIVDAALFPDQGEEGGTGAIISSIVVNDNLVDVTLTPGAKAGDPATFAASPSTKYVTFVNKATTAAAGTEPTIDLSDDKTNADGTHTVTISGTQPLGQPILYAYRVPEPQRFAEEAFALALADAGIAIKPAAKAVAFDHATAALAYTSTNLLAQHVSPPLSEEIYVTLKVSQNLHAALLPYMWAAYVARAKDNFLKAGFAKERGLLASAGLDTTSAVQRDGFGSFAFFTPDFMVRYLAWTSAQTWSAQLRRALPILGTDGTLFNIQNDSPARGKVAAKTGTWGSADLLNAEGLISKGLAGFMTTIHGRHVAFAFYINRMAGKHSADAKKSASHYAGETLGEIATDTYLTL